MYVISLFLYYHDIANDDNLFFIISEKNIYLKYEK